MHVAEVIAAAKAGEPVDLARTQRPVRRHSSRTQQLPFVGAPVAGSAARGPAADSARAAVEAGRSLTVTREPQAAEPADTSDGAAAGASGTPRR